VPEPAPTVVGLLRQTERWLRGKGVESPRLEAELLLAQVLGTTRIGLYLIHDRPLSPAEVAALRERVLRRGKREPLAWILGSAGFHALDLVIRPGVLVPRPDTETLVDAALSWIPAESHLVADIGCGSGAVGLALAIARPDLKIYAVDLAEAALATTRENVAALGLGARVAVLAGDLLGAIPPARRIDWVVSNPPYIPSGEIADLMPEVSRFEPRLALDGGPDGLDVYRKLAPAAWRRNARGILLEVGVGQAGRVADLLRRAGWSGIETWDDLAGIPRVVGGRRAASAALG
jgi:release factor glutamine methyltransferase